MIENLKKKAFQLFLGISLKRRLFITYLLLSSLILMLTSVFFYTASKKVLIKRAALSSQQQLSLITSNLGEKIDHISNYAITLSINSNIADDTLSLVCKFGIYQKMFQCVFGTCGIFF